MTQEKYHFIGIGGIGMSGLARILLKQEVVVSGSDVSSSYVTEGLIKAGANVHIGHAASNIPSGSNIVYSSDIKAENVEYQHALKMKYVLLHRADLLARMAAKKKSLAVAGTHGKTTTTALLTTVLIEAGKEPSFAVGGILPSLQTNAGSGKGEFFVLEADESDGSFLKYSPFGAIITNIDNDHLNHYGNTDSLVEAFRVFASQVISSDHLFWCGDDSYLRSLKLKGQSYGFSDHCNWKISNFSQQGWKIIFDLEVDGKHYKEIEASMAGHHNALNAAAVFGMSISLGISEKAIREAFNIFSGVLRRCEKKTNSEGILVLDDYAHHPTEILTTLKGIRTAVKQRRLIAVFQPHRYTRTRDCLGMYGNVFDAADEVWVTDVYGAGESPIPNVSHLPIMEEIEKSSAILCRYVPRKELAAKLKNYAETNDVIVTLGAGDITKVSTEMQS